MPSEQDWEDETTALQNLVQQPEYNYQLTGQIFW